MGGIWALVSTQLTAGNGNSMPANTRLGTSNGTCVLTHRANGDDDPYALLTVKTNRDKGLDTCIIEPNYVNAHRWGIDRDSLDTIVTRSKALAQASG